MKETIDFKWLKDEEYSAINETIQKEIGKIRTDFHPTRLHTLNGK